MENEVLSRPVYVARWRNFRRLLDERDLTITAAAEVLGKTQGQVSHFGGKKPSKPIGDQLATEIEAVFSLARGSLDLSNSGEGTVDEPPHGPGPVSQFQEPDEATLLQVLKWLGYEEGALGRYQPMRRLQRSIALYHLLQVDGGVLSPAHAAELVDAIRRQKGMGEDDGKPATAGAN